MHRKVFFQIMFILVFLNVSIIAPAAGKSGNRVPLLDGRYFITVPGNAQDKKHGHGIMERSRPMDGETRIVCDNNGEKFIIVARELYKYSKKNIIDDINRKLNSEKKLFKFKDLKSKTNCRIISGWPIEEKIDDDTFILLNAFIEGNDNILINIGFYINKSAFLNNRKKYLNLAKEVIATVEQGEKKLQLNKRSYSFYSYPYHFPNYIKGKVDNEIKLLIPENYAVTANGVEDFRVYNLIELSGYDINNNSSIGFYVGQYPSYIHSDKGFKFEPTRKLRGKILNRNIEWLIFEIKSGDKIDYILSEAIFQIYGDDGRDYLHIFTYSGSYDQMENQHRIIETMNITYTGTE